jgi:antitoxin ParD1/3/4
MSIQLAPETEALIQERVESGQFATAEEVVAAAIRLLDERERRLHWLRAELAIGEAQERRGESIELTRERFAEIIRQARQDARDGKPVKDAVKP